MRVCLLGGTFDPPHLGHLLIAETLRTMYTLEKFIFIPANIPPHKKNHNISEAEHRIQMLQLIADDNPHFFVDTCEMDREGVSYTIDTIRDVKKRESLNNEEIGFLIGADNYLELHQWKSAEQLVKECQIIVTRRPNYSFETEKRFEHEVQFVNLPQVEISSSSIRERVQQGKSIRYYVLPYIQKYIESHQLYSR